MSDHAVILGAGQLGYLLCQAAQSLGVETTIVTPEAQAPASAAADHVLVSALDNAEAVAPLAARGMTITFEIEAIGQDVLSALEASPNAPVAAQAQVLRLLQNKLRQKQWLLDQGLPTSAFVALHAAPELQAGAAVGDSAQAAAASFAGEHGYPFVQKASEGGYDGKGVQFIRSAADLSRLWPGETLLEVFVPQAEELTVLVARSLTGEVRTYDPVTTEFNQQGHVLDRVIAPALQPQALTDRAIELAEAVVTGLQGVGLFAVELFKTTDGQLLVNEISPRVHNAGHHTLEGCVTSQFEQHLLAVLGRPLGPTTMTGAVAVMKNLLAGPHDVAGLLGLGPCAIPYQGAVLHWYGKAEARNLRKMGHVTALGSDLTQAEDAVERVFANLQQVAAGAAA